MVKPNLLIYSDFFGTSTGFGVVSKYTISALKDQFNIDQLAINYNGQFFNQTEWPVQVVPAKLNNPNDPYGGQMFINTVATGKYDYIWVMNDSFVVHEAGKELIKVLDNLKQSKRKVPIVLYYLPIDCQLLKSATGMLEAADHVIAYCKFGREEILKTMPELDGNLSIIEHGTDKTAFFPTDADERRLLRQQLFKVTDDETFVWLNVNRNSARKDIAKTISSFAEFKKKVPNSKLYLHTAIRDMNIDLSTCVDSLGLSLKTDVLFPANYAAHKPLPIPILNAIYNASDAFITTTLGEGWGLSAIDAMLVRKPVVAPSNTVFFEQLNPTEITDMRGYIYPCKDMTYIDNSGYRPVGNTTDICKVMNDCYQNSISNSPIHEAILNNAYNWAAQLSWESIGQKWLELFKTVKKKETKIQGITL